MHIEPESQDTRFWSKSATCCWISLSKSLSPSKRPSPPVFVTSVNNISSHPMTQDEIFYPWLASFLYSSGLSIHRLFHFLKQDTGYVLDPGTGLPIPYTQAPSPIVTCHLWSPGFPFTSTIHSSQSEFLKMISRIIHSMY